MKKVRILHCADLHFDTPFKELSKEISRVSKNELLEVFKNIIDLTIKEQVEVLFIAGDIFDNLTVNKNTLFFISKELKRINNVNIFISPGNHDPYNEKSFYKMVNWPSNVHIFEGQMESVEVKELNLAVWGAGFRTNYENESLLTNLSLDKSKINIMILHGEIENGNTKNQYNPIYLSDIKECNIDYLALGHRHKFSGILKEGITNYAYSGCPQGRGFDEEGSKGVIVGNVYCSGVDLSFIPTSKRIYVTKEINITEINRYDDLINKVVSLFSEEDRMRNLYKIIFIGEIEEGFVINNKIINKKLKDKFYYIKIIDNTKIAVDLEESMQNYSVKGKFISKILEALNEAPEYEKEILNMALQIGIKSLSEDEVNLNDY